MTNRKAIMVVLGIFLLIVGFSVLIGWYTWKDAEKSNVETELDKELAKMQMVADSKNSSVPSASTQSPANTVPANTPKPQPKPTPSLQPSQPANESPSPAPQPTPEEKSEEPEIKNYVSEKFKVSFTYPEGFKVDEDKDITVEKNSKKVSFKVYEMEEADFEKWFLDNYEKKNNTDCDFVSASLKVGSCETKQVKLKSSGTKCENAGYFALNSDKSKTTRVEVSSETDEDIKKILDSFKYL